jgi:DNA/RNA-binding domain of Phe-tRNA-synthetase-like protein
MMLAGATQQEIADAVGVHRHTVRAIQQTPEVMEELERIQREARSQAVRVGSGLLNSAVGVWRDALKATDGAIECPACGESIAGAPDHAVRLKAADSVADRFGLPKTEVQELQGALTLSDKSDAELERVTLEEAIAILDAQGNHEAAAAVRATLAI